MSAIVKAPEVYCPTVDVDGNYVDYVPAMHDGLVCPCASRKDYIYKTLSSFTTHIRSKHHTNWLEVLNNNKKNYFAEYENQRKLIKNQQMIINELEKKLKEKDITIDYLTNQLTNEIKLKRSSEQMIDLLDIDTDD